jgi:hypothetical protein
MQMAWRPLLDSSVAVYVSVPAELPLASIFRTWHGRIWILVVSIEQLQLLESVKYGRRLEYWNWLISHLIPFDRHILFIDGFHFAHGAVKNSRNWHLFFDVNRNWRVEANFQYGFFADALCGCVSSHLTGPLFLVAFGTWTAWICACDNSDKDAFWPELFGWIGERRSPGILIHVPKVITMSFPRWCPIFLCFRHLNFPSNHGFTLVLPDLWAACSGNSSHSCGGDLVRRRHVLGFVWKLFFVLISLKLG